MTEANDQEPERIDRRSAIKKAAAAGAAAGVVWSAPKVAGLSLRPNYAAAQSGTSGAEVFSIGATGGQSSFQSSRQICGGNARVYVQVRKDFINNPRNIAVQTQTFNGETTFDTTNAGVNPSSYLPGGINGAAGGYNFNGNLNGDGPLTVNIPYICT